MGITKERIDISSGCVFLAIDEDGNYINLGHPECMTLSEPDPINWSRKLEVKFTDLLEKPVNSARVCCYEDVQLLRAIEKYAQKRVDDYYENRCSHLPNGCGLSVDFVTTDEIVHSDKFAVERVIYNDPATIVLWKDGTKTVSTAQNEPYDPEKGLAMCFAKKALGNNYKAGGVFKRLLRKAPKKVADDAAA